MNASLQLIAHDFNISDFSLYKTSDAFDIYRYNADQKIEYAVLRQMSKPHYHSITGEFLFMDPGILQLGGIKLNTSTAYISEFTIDVGVVYPIPAYVLHAAGPADGQDATRLLIINDTAVRERNHSEYTDDTVFPGQIILL